MNKLRVATVALTVPLILLVAGGTASASPGSPDPFWYGISPHEGFRYWFGTAWFAVAKFLNLFGIELSY